jgi:chemotaxis signal transduction protein
MTFEHDEQRVQSLLRERSLRLATPPVSRDSAWSLVPHVVFRASGESYGLPLERVHEIFGLSRTTPLPGAPVWVVGLTARRGEFVTVCDIARFLGLGDPDDEMHPYAISLRGSDLGLALTASSLDGIVRLDPAELQPSNRSGPQHSELFTGLSSNAVQVLEPARLLDRLKGELRAA